jgi:FtsZ-binding cell division protein ZapB
MTKYTPEVIKNRLSNIGEAIGTITLEYIVELEKENQQLKQRYEKAKITLKILEKTNDTVEEVFCLEKLKELLGDTNDKR